MGDEAAAQAMMPRAWAAGKVLRSVVPAGYGERVSVIGQDDRELVRGVPDPHYGVSQSISSSWTAEIAKAARKGSNPNAIGSSLDGMLTPVRAPQFRKIRAVVSVGVPQVVDFGMARSCRPEYRSEH